MTRAEMSAFIYRAVNAGAPPPPTPTVDPFPDVSKDAWYAGYVKWMADAGITVGYGDGTFKPDREVTRAETAAFIARAKGVPSPPTPLSDPFPDVPVDHWASGYAQWLVDQGIAKGYPDGSFGPERPVTRAEMATFIARGWSLIAT